MEKLLSKQFILQNLGTFGAIVVIFTYSILLDRDLACTCKQQDRQCFVYLLVPPCLIWVLMLWTRKTFLIICRKCYCCKLLCFLCKDIFKSLLTGLLWIAFVLIDGDWYVCCRNDHSKQQAQLACKTQANLTYEDRVIIAELKNESRIIGITLLAVIVGVAALMSWFEGSCCCPQPSKENVYYKMILKEEQNVLKEILRESSKSQLTEGIKEEICKKEWTKCFDVAEDLTNNQRTKPRLKKEEEAAIKRELEKKKAAVKGEDEERGKRRKCLEWCQTCTLESDPTDTPDQGNQQGDLKNQQDSNSSGPELSTPGQQDQSF